MVRLGYRAKVWNEVRGNVVNENGKQCWDRGMAGECFRVGGVGNGLHALLRLVPESVCRGCDGRLVRFSGFGDAVKCW